MVRSSLILVCSKRPFGQQLLDGLCNDGSWATLERGYILDELLLDFLFSPGP